MVCYPNERCQRGDVELKIKIYIEADFDADVHNEMHDEQIIHQVVDDNLALMCKELDLTEVDVVRFEVDYGDEG